MSTDSAPASCYDLEPYRVYLRLLASQHIASRYRGKVDLSGVVQETLWEAHQEIARGLTVPAGQRLPWLRRILTNNLADAVRRLTTEKRDIEREVSLEQAVEMSSQRLEAWLANDLQPGRELEHEEQVLQLVGALAKLPPAQRESLILHYWTGWTLVQISEHLGRTRDAVAGLIKRGIRHMRLELGAAQGSNEPAESGHD